MKVLSLYVEGDSLVHKLAPVTKLVYAVTSVIITLLFPSLLVGSLFVVLSFILSLNARIMKHMLTLLAVVLVLSISILIIQVLFNPSNQTVIFEIGNIKFYKEGLVHAFVLILRLYNMIISFGILILTTKPSDLVDNLVQRGLSPKFGYILSSVLQVIPQMLSTTSTIIDAQRSRGLETEGNFFRKMKAFVALLGPLVLSSLVEARERAMAIEVRGFDIQGKRTMLNEIRETNLDKFILNILRISLVFAIVWRIVLWVIH